MRLGRRTPKQDDFLGELSLLIRSRYGLIWVQTVERERMESLLWYLGDSLDLPLFTWTLNGGLKRFDLDKPVYQSGDPKVALDHVLSSRFAALYYFEGLEPFLDDPVLASKFVDVVRCFTERRGAVIVTGNDVDIPDAVKSHSAVVPFPTPGREEFKELLKDVLRDLDKRMQPAIAMGDEDMNRLLNNLQGLTLTEAEKVLTKAIVEDGRLTAEDINLVVQEKKAVIEREGLLEFTPVDRGMQDIADLVSLKAWLGKRKNIITDPEGAARVGLTFPKGILLLGVPGSGKSLCAKAVAMEWGLPLLKMDPSRLYNKYIGESEKNFRRAMETAERLSPVVLWIDEIEKAFAGENGEDGGVSQRVLGIFLSWLQDRKGSVFVAATANDISKLPPELLRKGRFDEIFFVDIPDAETRGEIFRIHLELRGHDPAMFDLAALAAGTGSFTGAEIEQVVVSALYTTFSSDAPLSTEVLLEEARKTTPLSVVRAEYISRLRDWARERTVPAQ
jgi:SpoVK/Ycf46/Vps4 family AAA+-type ATPase